MSTSPPAVTELTKEQLQFLRDIDSPTIANAIEPFELRDRCDGFIGGTIRPLVAQPGRMVGYAVTVTMTNGPGEIASRDGYWKMWEALEQMPNPSVLVIQDVSGAPTRCALSGEVMATMAQRLGAVGMVTDGGFRDVEEVQALGMHYYAPFAVVSHANFSIVDVGIPITLDGQEINPGALLHGDANGIVIVPTEIVSDLPDAVDTIRTRERQTMDYIKSPEFTLAGAKAASGY